MAGQQSAASPLLDVANFTSTQGTTTCGEEGQQKRMSRRRLAGLQVHGAHRGLLRQLLPLRFDGGETTQNIDADLLSGGEWRSSRVALPGAAKETWRARLLRKAGAHTRNLTNCGSNAGILWGSEVQHDRLVVLAWANGRLEGVPDLNTMQATLRGAIAILSHLRNPWCGAADAAATFVLTLLRLGAPSQPDTSQPTMARRSTSWVSSPQTVGFCVDQATLVWSDSSAHWGKLEGSAFLASSPTLVGPLGD